MPRSPRPRSCTCARAAARMSETTPRARSGSRTQSAPLSRRPARRSSPRHRRARVPPTGRTRARLHPRKRHPQPTLPCRGASLASAFRGESGVHLVLASDATAWSLHPGKWRRQLTTPARRSCRTRRRAARGRHLLYVDAGPVGPEGTRACPPCHHPTRAARALARFGRLSPRRVLPPGPANLGLPLITRLLRKLAK